MRPNIDLNGYEIKKFLINGKEMGRGCSGQLLLATGPEYYENGKPKKDKWILKHNFPHLAASEYLYHRIARELGIGSPTVHLINFYNLKDEVRVKFDTPYVVAIEYLDTVVRSPSIEDIHNIGCGFYYYGHKMLQYIFRGRDSFDIIIGKSTRRAYPELYRLDVSESFWLPPGLNNEEFYLRINTTKYLHSRMTQATDEWNESCIDDILRFYWSQIDQAIAEKNRGEDVHNHGYGLHYYRAIASMLSKISPEFFWKLLDDLGEVYNYHTQEIFMLYFLRMNKFLEKLMERFEEVDPFERSMLHRLMRV